MSTKPAAAVAAAKLPHPSAAVNYGIPGRELSEEESDYEPEPNTSTKREPPTKRARPPTNRRKNSLSLLPTMPLDVLLSQLAPKDLLSVSHSNKLFRETLLASSARTVWKRALEGVGAPECPSDFLESRWARLLFGTSCEVGLWGENIQEVDFFIRRRAVRLAEGEVSFLIIRSKAAVVFPDCDDLVLRLVPSTNVGAYACSWKSDITDMICAMDTYKQKTHMRTPGAQNDLATFIAQRTVLIDKIQSTETEFRTWLSKFMLSRQYESQDSVYRRRDAIRKKFLELGYEPRDLSNLSYEKAFNQETALTDSVWKRIRPILEPCVQKRKNELLANQVAIQLRDTMLTRRNIVEQLYSSYKSTIPPLQWKYLPAVGEIIRKEPFKALIYAELDVSVTVDNIKPLMLKLPEVVTEIQDELKALLVHQLTLASRANKILPSNCLDLATSVFHCKGSACNSSIYVVGTNDILSHNCDIETRSHGGYVDPILGALVRCAGLDPKTALASEMYDKDLRFASHKILSFGVVERLNNWRILSRAETDFLRENELERKWLAANWSCSHCPIALGEKKMNRKVVVKHVQTVHKISSPTVPTDLFFFEKVVKPFRI
ncbi:hypothetical protein BJ912DRAFT_986423 [Pholiota molesta]|nr:hypothetical protein BJ912DRAFT_986423 [Pholiota molesta]